MAGTCSCNILKARADFYPYINSGPRRNLRKQSRGMTEKEKIRSIQEYVPGKQATLAHLIAHPDRELCQQIGVAENGAIGLMTITPGEGAIIAADAASKNGDIKLEYVDRFTGCLVFTGEVAAVESALKGALDALTRILGFSPAPLTKT